MLAHDVGVNGLRCNIFQLAQHVAETSGVQHGAGADDALVVQAGSLPYGVSQDVHWVGGNQEDAIKVIRHDIGDDAVHDLDVLAHQVQAGLARLLCGTGADDDHIGVCAIGVGALGDAGASGGPDNTVVEVHDVAL